MQTARSITAAIATTALLAGCSTTVARDDAAIVDGPSTAFEAPEDGDDGSAEAASTDLDEDDDGGSGAAQASQLTTTGGAAADSAEAERAAPAQRIDDPAIGFEPNQPDPGAPDERIGPFVTTAEDARSTFALDVDTSSWTQTLAWLEAGQRPPADIVRPEEFVNAIDYGYTQPSEGWSIQLDGVGRSPWNDDTALLRVGLTTAGIDPAERPDATLTFVVDTSGSMSGQPLRTVKSTLAMLVGQLRPTDRIGIVEYGSRARVVLAPTVLAESDAVLDAIDALQTNGSTNAGEGLAVGYEMAQGALTPGGIDVVVLASDGVANVGATEADEILELIDEGVESGIGLLALGVSERGYNDQLMEQLSNRGNGATYYLRDERDAERLFVDELEQTLVVAAVDSKVQVTFDEDVVREYRLIGYDNRAIADDDFRNDAVDAGEVGVGHEVTAIYELRLADVVRPTARVATVALRWQDPTDRDVRETEAVVGIEQLVPDVDTGFGAAVQAVTLAEVLRRSPHVELDVDALTELTVWDPWGTSTELTAAIRDAAAAAPAPGE